MSRRLATVLRVAALQERLAKAEAGRAAVAVAAAEDEHDARVRALSETRLQPGSQTDVARDVAMLGLRARAVTAARQDTEAAQAARSASLDAWTRARGRHTLLEELDARLAADRQAAELAAAQRLADDLSAGRRAVRA